MRESTMDMIKKAREEAEEREALLEALEDVLNNVEINETCYIENDEDGESLPLDEMRSKYNRNRLKAYRKIRETLLKMI